MLTLLVWIGWIVGSGYVWWKWPEDQPLAGMWALILILFLIATVWTRGLKR